MSTKSKVPHKIPTKKVVLCDTQIHTDSLSMNLEILFSIYFLSIYELVVWSVKWQEIAKNSHHSSSVQGHSSTKTEKSGKAGTSKSLASLLVEVVESISKSISINPLRCIIDVIRKI